jgi:thiol-disulfide isomerase/thioredoxin
MQASFSVTRNSFSWQFLAALFALGVATSCLATTGLAQEPADDAPAEKTESAEKTARPAIYNEDANAEEQIAAALAKAKKENRRVLIQWGANWCGWCHLLHECFTTKPEIRQKLMYEYDLVLVDVGHADKNLELAKKYEADFGNQGLPFLTVLDGDGNVVVNQETEALEEKVKDVQEHDAAAVLEFLTLHQATAPAAADVFADGMKEAKASGRLLLLHFGAPWCGWCHRMEDWMARPDNAEVLGKYFHPVKIDTDRMAGGEELLEKQRDGAEGGIPWFLFIDPSTEEVIAVSHDAEGNNIGFPWTDGEIAAFGEMLRKTGDRIPAGLIDTLTASLKANREKTEAEQNDGG